MTFDGSVLSASQFKSINSAGDEGGQIDLAKSVTNTTLNTGITIDVYQNKLRIFETGGTNRGYFLDISTAATSVGSALIPTGSLQAYAGSSAPTGWLLCDGSSKLRTDYPDLFTVIGTTYGSADGTHFNIPDLRGRTLAGLDNMGGSDAGRLDLANTLGTTTGAQYHTLSITEMPSHNHPGSTVGRSGADDNNHTGNGDFVADSDAGYTGTRSVSVASQGGGGAHNNMQPTILVNYIIKI
jgi:microcystin-dependent protein